MKWFIVSFFGIFFIYFFGIRMTHDGNPNTTTHLSKKSRMMLQIVLRRLPPNDPASLNALNSVMKSELYQALITHNTTQPPKWLSSQARARIFSGGDIREMLSGAETAKTENGTRLTIGIVGGYYAPSAKSASPLSRVSMERGGRASNIALACDFRVASDNAKFYKGVCQYRACAWWGRYLSVIQLIGGGKTTELVMLASSLMPKGRRFGTGECAGEPRCAWCGSEKLTDRLTSLPTLALAAMKQPINQVAFAGLDIALDQEVIPNANGNQWRL